MDKAKMNLDKWIFTENPTIFFENTPVGRCKKEVWDMSEEEVDRVLREDYGIPAPPELDKAGSYGIQELPDGYLDKYEGSFENIVGLAPESVEALLKQLEYNE